MSNRNPLVCICIPTYNAERTIADTLHSLLEQTYTHFVIKIVDNASTDGTLSVVRKFKDPRISVIQGVTNIGGEGNFNRCIDLATGEYTAIFHADDLYERTMVARQVAEFEENPEVGAVFSEATLIDESGQAIGSVRRPPGLRRNSHIYDFQKIFKAVLRHSNFLMCPSAMLRTKIYREEIQRFRADLFGSSADLDVWLRVLERHSISILPDRQIRYRISPTQGSYTLGRARVARADLFLVIDHYLKKAHVRRWVNRHDIRNKERLERTDMVVRASNLFLLDRRDEARALIEGAFTVDAVQAAVGSLRGLQTLLLSTFLKVAMVPLFDSHGKSILRIVKRVTRR
jgi:glycosyltransferase involved in cell wall biosynthesis